MDSVTDKRGIEIRGHKLEPEEYFDVLLSSRKVELELRRFELKRRLFIVTGGVGLILCGFSLFKYIWPNLTVMLLLPVILLPISLLVDAEIKRWRLEREIRAFEGLTVDVKNSER